MKLQIAENFDKKLVELYSNQVTFNLNTESNVDASKIWNSMEMIAVNRKAMINFRVR